MMSRHHFKDIMFTPDFVKRSRAEMGHYNIEKNVQKRFTKIKNVLLFWKKFKGNK
jgi:hypothetical protein